MCRLKKNLMCFRCDNIQSAGARAVEHRLASAPLPLAPGDADWILSPLTHIRFFNQRILFFRSAHKIF